jgi:ATP-dependent exoDNAse (exonuclease V) beta subunit
MTVHKAKGLEFPVVILADLTCKISRGDASRYLDAARGLCAMKIGGWAPIELYDHEDEEVARDQAEGVRLAYVAATRARDLLVVPALGDAPWEGGWFGPLNRALYPPMEARRSAVRGPQCPAFKSKDSVLQRPNDEPAGPATVSPGLHQFDDGYSVAWWDPNALTLDLKPIFGVRREDLIVKDVPKNVVADGRGRYDRWKLARHDARAAGAAASLAIVTVREWVAAEAATGGDAAAERSGGRIEGLVEVVNLTREPEARPGGTVFGLLVHDLLARVPFGSNRSVLVELAAAQARALGLDQEAAQVAVAIAERLLTHDLLARAAAAETRGACRRETPVSAVMPDGTMVEGVVDLAFEEKGVWTVVDYKTDRELATGEAEYRRQVSFYASAIAQATGQPAKAVLVHV